MCVGRVYELGQRVVSQLCMFWLYVLVVWVHVLCSLLVLTRDVREIPGCFGGISFLSSNYSQIISVSFRRFQSSFKLLGDFHVLFATIYHISYLLFLPFPWTKS